MFGHAVNRNVYLQFGVLSIDMMDGDTEGPVVIHSELDIDITIGIGYTVPFGLGVDNPYPIVFGLTDSYGVLDWFVVGCIIGDGHRSAGIDGDCKDVMIDQRFRGDVRESKCGRCRKDNQDTEYG